VDILEHPAIALKEFNAISNALMDINVQMQDYLLDSARHLGHAQNLRNAAAVFNAILVFAVLLEIGDVS
jgi:hypothetical protein